MEESKHLFHAFGPAHLAVIFLTIVLPFVLALIVRRAKSQFLERSICFAISALLLINYVAYLIVARHFGVTTWQRALPMQLCDWAMFVIIVALWTGNRQVFAYARLHPRAGRFLGLANFGDFPESCDAGILARAGLPDPHPAPLPAMRRPALRA